MRLVVASCVATVVATSFVAVAAGQAARGQMPTGPATASARPASGTAATIAAGDEVVVAWLAGSPGAGRILAATGTEELPTSLGPISAGLDGAPASATSDDGAVWMAASRDYGTTQQLWLQRRAAGRWQEPIDGPYSRLRAHHPAIAVAPGSSDVWVVWIGDDGRPSGKALYASRWMGDRWTSVETLPPVAGAPMAPSIAIEVHGRPVVAWAANDGTDAEIWVTERRADGWSRPIAVSRNLVPDITPSIAAGRNGLLVAWISFTREGYLPMVRTGSDIDNWDDAEIISEFPGGRPRAIWIDESASIFWRHLENDPVGGTIRSRIRGADGWLPAVALAAASGSPFAVATSDDGRLLLAFSRPNGRLGLVAGKDGTSGGELDALKAASAARYGSAIAPALLADPAPAADEGEVDPLPPIVPESYTAFGDSITNGVVYDPERRTSPGYRDPLQKQLRGFLGVGTVFNAGVDGESTADGLGRIDNAIAAQDSEVILIMEGTNDILAEIDVNISAFNLRQMVRRAYEEKPDVLPFLGQLPPRLAPGPEGFNGSGNGRIDELNQKLLGIGLDEGAIVVDMNTPIDGNPSMMSNHVHPSTEGYGVMADQWYTAVQPAVLALTNRGDLDASGRADGIDLVRLALAFGAIIGEERYDESADVNGDGIIDGFDLGILLEFFGQPLAEGS